MNKKILVILLVFILSLSVTAPIMAEEDLDQGGAAPTQDQGGMFERAVAGIINSLVVVFQGLEEAGKFKTLDKLVFNIDLSTEEREMAPFTSNDWDKLKKWYIGMSGASGGFALIAVLLTSYKLILAGSINPQARKEAMEGMWRWLGAISLIAGAAPLFYIMFQLNINLVDVFKAVGAFVGGESSTADLSNLSLTGNSVVTNLSTGSVLGTALVKLIFCGIEAWLNIIYYMRLATLMTIFVFTPIMAWMWAINKNVNAYSIWFGELLSNAFMQSAHALCIMIFLTFCNVKDGTSWIQLLIWMAIILPLAEMLRNSVQGIFTRMAGFDEAGAATKVMGMMGFGSLMGMGNLMSTAMPIKMPTTGITPPNMPPTMSGAGINSPSSMSPTMPGGYGQSASFSPLSGMAATQGISGGPGGGPAAGTDTPPGYTTTQSGLAVPHSARQDSGNETAAHTQRTGVRENTAPGLGMIRAANMARAAAGITGTVAGATAGIMFSAVPGGREIQNLASRAVGGAAGAAVSMGNVAKQTLDTYRNNDGYTLGQSFREVTGSQTNTEAFKKATALSAVEGITPMVSQNRNQATGMSNNMLQNIVPTMDGHRWR